MQINNKHVAEALKKKRMKTCFNNNERIDGRWWPPSSAQYAPRSIKTWWHLKEQQTTPFCIVKSTVLPGNRSHHLECWFISIYYAKQQLREKINKSRCSLASADCFLLGPFFAQCTRRRKNGCGVSIAQHKDGRPLPVGSMCVFL